VSPTDEIGDLGALVGLLLALVTLFTANRATAIRTLKAAPDLTDRERVREIWLNASLAAVTFLVFLAGLPLVVRALNELHPLAHGGPVRSVFILVWLLLIGLIAWQVSLVLAARKLQPPH
jgi:hypothetical protein